MLGRDSSDNVDSRCARRNPLASSALPRPLAGATPPPSRPLPLLYTPILLQVTNPLPVLVIDQHRVIPKLSCDPRPGDAFGSERQTGAGLVDVL